MRSAGRLFIALCAMACLAQAAAGGGDPYAARVHAFNQAVAAKRAAHDADAYRAARGLFLRVLGADDRLTAYANFHLGQLAGLLDVPAEARSRFEAALGWARRERDMELARPCWFELGVIKLRQRDWKAARADLESAQAGWGDYANAERWGQAARLLVACHVQLRDARALAALLDNAVFIMAKRGEDLAAICVEIAEHALAAGWPAVARDAAAALLATDAPGDPLLAARKCALARALEARAAYALGRFETARAALDAARPLARVPAVDGMLAEIEARLLALDGRYAEAGQVLERAFPAMSDRYRGELANLAATWAYEAGDYGRAAALLEHALGALTASAADQGWRARVLVNRSHVREALGRGGPALADAREAVAAADAGDDPGARALARRRLGVLLASRGELGPAADAYLAALRLGDDSPRDRAETLTLLGDLQLRLGRPADAATSLAGAVTAAGDETGAVAAARLLLARALDRTGKTAEAAAARATALAEALRAGDGLLEGVARHDSGLALLRAGRPAAAIPFLEHAALLVETRRARLAAGDDGRIVFLGAHLDTFRALALACAAANRPADAWRAVERALARSLHDELLARHPRLTAGSAAAGGAAATRLAAARRASRLAAATARDLGRLPGLPAARLVLARERAAAARTALVALERALLATTAGAYGREPGADALTALQARLKADRAVAVQFAWSASLPVLVFVISGDSVECRQAGSAAELAPLVARYRALAEKPLAGRRWDPRVFGTVDFDDRAVFVDAGHTLARRLLDPALAAMRRSGADRLLVIPDGPLALVPWSAIPLAGASPADLKPLGLVYPVALAPSAAVALLLARADAGDRPRRFLGLALTAATRLDTPVGTIDLPALPWAATECTNIAATFTRSQVLLDAAATRAGLAAGLSAGPTHLHFATHGVFLPRRGETNAVSALALAGPGTAFRLDDALALSLPGTAVVLSACETALGTAEPGEGYASFARAFLVAGARSATAALWRVADESTAAYMARYYGELAAGKSAPDAHRAAAAALAASRWKWPCSWAGFVHWGWVR